MIENNWISLLLYLILFFPFLLAIYDSIYRLIFLVVAHLPNKPVSHEGGPKQDLRLLMLVIARNEERVIERTLERIKCQADLDPSIDVAVLADHCSDQTVAIARSMGVKVYIRTDGSAGKSQALSWLVKEQKKALASADVVTILDADTLVDVQFCEQISRAFKPGVDVVQGSVNPVSQDGFPLSTLASFSDALSQKIDDVARSRLGWAVPLRGTGMAFTTDIFCEVCQGLGTQVDDIELSVRLAEIDVIVHYVPEVQISDPKEDNILGLAKQRGRWLKGQRQVWNSKKQEVLKLLKSGLSNWSLIHALLIKPKTALFSMKILIVFILLLATSFNHFASQVLVIIVLTSIVIDLLYYLTGTRLVQPSLQYFASLLGAPLYVILWVVGWSFSIFPNRGWLRARNE